MSGSLADPCAENSRILVQELLVLSWDRFCFHDLFGFDSVRILLEGDHSEAEVMRCGCGSQLEGNGWLAVVVQVGVATLPAYVQLVFHEKIEAEDGFVDVCNDARVVVTVAEPELDMFYPIGGNAGAVDCL